MILLLLLGCGLVMLYICTHIILCLMVVKFGLMVPLPVGPEVQEVSANSKSAETVSVILECIAENTMVSSVQIWSCHELTPIILKMQYLVSDATIVWRAWAIWTESRITRFVLMLMLIVDIGVIFVLLSLYFHSQVISYQHYRYRC